MAPESTAHPTTPSRPLGEAFLPPPDCTTGALKPLFIARLSAAFSLPNPRGTTSYLHPRLTDPAPSTHLRLPKITSKSHSFSLSFTLPFALSRLRPQRHCKTSSRLNDCPRSRLSQTDRGVCRWLSRRDSEEGHTQPCLGEGTGSVSRPIAAKGPLEGDLQFSTEPLPRAAR